MKITRSNDEGHLILSYINWDSGTSEVFLMGFIPSAFKSHVSDKN